MCEKCSMDQLHPTPPSRRSVVLSVASALGLMLAGTANAKEAKAHQKDASLRLADTLKGGAFLTQGDAARITKENLRLQMEIVKLKAQKEAPAPVKTTGTKGDLVRKEIPARVSGCCRRPNRGPR